MKWEQLIEKQNKQKQWKKLKVKIPENNSFFASANDC